MPIVNESRSFIQIAHNNHRDGLMMVVGQPHPNMVTKATTSANNRDYATMIYPDPDSEKMIMGSLVFCIHHKQGCNWHDELRKLKAHLNACKHDATSCPNKCGAQIPRVMMSDHILYTCTQRRATCEYCGTEFSGQGLEDHTGTCSQEPIYCEAKCGVRVFRGRMSVHRSKDCAKRLRRCPHCKREFSADTLAAHGATCPLSPITCPKCCNGTPIARAELESHLRDECVALSIPCTFKEAGCRFKGPRHIVESHIEGNTVAHLSLMVSLSGRQNQQIQLLKNAITKLSTNYTGTLLWKVTDWQSKMTEAKTKDGLELVSPAFYTSQYGYKLQASMFLNGNGPGEGSHVSVYIKVLPGDFDALLKWPFSHSITFTLFEQGVQQSNSSNSNNSSNNSGIIGGGGGSNNSSSGCSNNSSSNGNIGGCNGGYQGGVAESFVPDPSWSNFQRPSHEPDSLGFGFPRFISHELLNRRPFVKDDVVFLRVKVDPSKIVAV